MSKKFKSIEKSLKNFFNDMEKETEEMFGEGTFLDTLLSSNKKKRQKEKHNQKKLKK